jgi:anaerobic selenocysteine-containing dehydrogenase
VATLHPDEAARNGLTAGEAIRVVSPQGRIAAILKTEAGILPGILKIDQGWWRQSGSVNCLTADTLSDMGENAAYFESFCRIEPLTADHGDNDQCLPKPYPQA